MKRLNLSPELKSRATKWGLTGALLTLLGFNLSMNPQMANVARNEYKVYSLDLASAEPAKAENKDGSKQFVGTTYDLKNLDPSLSRLKVTVFGESGTAKFAVEGATAETCPTCTKLVRLKLSGNSEADIQKAILQYIQDNQAALAELGKTTAGKADETAEENCSAKKDDKLYACQKKAYFSLIKSCEVKKSSSEKETCFESIQDKLDDSFKALKKYAFKNCIAASATGSDAFDNSNFASADCDDVVETMKEVIEKTPSRKHAAAAVDFNKQYDVRQLANDWRTIKGQLDRKEIAPFQANALIAQKIDQLTGIRAAIDPRTGSWVILPEVSPDSHGGEIMDAMEANPYFNKAGDDKAEDRLVAAFRKYYLDKFSQERMKTLKNPANANPMFDFSYSADGTVQTGGSIDLAKIRAAGRVQGAMPQIPPLVGQGQQNNGVFPQGGPRIQGAPGSMPPPLVGGQPGMNGNSAGYPPGSYQPNGQQGPR